MNISIRLLESNNEIAKKINKAIAEEVNSQIVKNAPRLKKLLVATIPVWIRTQPEMESLLSQGVPHTLNAEFGLRPGEPNDALEAIINAIVETIEIRFKKVDANLVGGVEFRFQPSSFKNLLGLSEGHVIAASRISGEQHDLHWLEWLLMRGDEIIVVGYEYTPSSGGSARGHGRSGGGLMKEGGAWRVPPEFSGVDTDNVITRAFDGRERELTLLLSGLFK